MAFMLRKTWLVLGLLAGSGCVGLAVVSLTSSPSMPVYTVAQVQAGLRRHPTAWTGRIVLIRGTITSTGSGSPIGPTRKEVLLSAAIPVVGPGLSATLPRGAFGYVTLTTDSTDPRAAPLTLGVHLQTYGFAAWLATLRGVPPLRALLPFLNATPAVLRLDTAATYRVQLLPAGFCPPYDPAHCYAGLLIDPA